MPDAAPAGPGRVPDHGPAGAGRVPDHGPAGAGRVPDHGPAGAGRVPDAGPAGAGRVPDAGPAGAGRLPDAGPAAAELGEQGSQRSRAWLLGVVLVTLLAGGLRLVGLARVPENPFYDAAVRSMTQSLHNFFFGAFDPSASAAIDKPPFDLWLQVVAVKLLGFNSTVLKLPSAIAGTLAAPLLYDLVRRLAGRPAGLASALALAALPAAVVTARSDTMDSLMMFLLVLCAWLLLRYAERRQAVWLVLAALVLGLDFNVKLFEALVPVPAFLVFLWVCWRGEPVAVRLLRLGVVAAAFSAVALSWLVVVSLTAARERPYPIGSTNGSVWNAVFVYNGTDRVTQAPHPSTYDAVPTAAAAAPVEVAATRPTSIAAKPPVRPKTAPKHHKARPPSAPAGPLRLFRRSLVDFGGLIGTVLFASLVFGVLAAASAARRLLRLPPGADRAAAIGRAAALGLGVWLLTGLVLFSFAGRVHPRYLEAFTPAVAATLGVSVYVLARRARDPFIAYVLLAGLAVSLLEAAAVTGHGTLVRAGLAVGVLVAGLATGLLVLGARAAGRTGSWPRWSGPGVLTVAVVGSVLCFPLARDVSLIRDHSGVQAASPQLKAPVVAALSRYLGAHRGGARYEFAASAPSFAAPLIVRDARPILLLTTVDARPLVTLTQLRSRIGAGQVSYVLMRGRCPHPPYHILPACSAAVRWVQAHGTDVTGDLGLQPAATGLLFHVTPAAAALG
jgi:4-amino-4-deoxy-L-arabinose transferase-like glycosyltransferase